MEYTIIQQGNTGGAFALDEGHKAGEMTFSVAGPQLKIIDHTEVDSEYKGRGLGLELLKTLIDSAREEGFKLMPLCPFAKAMFGKFPQYNDVLFSL